MESAEEKAKLAYESYKNGKYPSAIEMYTSLLADKEESAYFAMRADCHYKLEDFTACFADAKRAIELDEDNCVASAILGGKAATKLEKFEEAYYCYKAGLKAAPGHQEIVADLKELQKIILKDIEKKGSDLEEKGYKAVDLCGQDIYPGDDELYKLELDILAKKYKIEAEPLRPTPTDTKILDQVANASLSGHKCMMEGKWSEALNLFTVALNLDPSNHILRRLRAEVFFMKDDAIGCLRDLWLVPKVNRMADAWLLGGK